METQILYLDLGGRKIKSGFDLPGYHIRLQVLYRAGQSFQQKWALPSESMMYCSGRKLEGAARGGKRLGMSQEEYLLTVDHIWNIARYMPSAASWISTENCQAQFFDWQFSCCHITYNDPQENHIKTEQDWHTNTHKNTPDQKNPKPILVLLPLSGVNEIK